MNFSWQIGEIMTEIEELRQKFLNAGDIYQRLQLLDLCPKVQKLLSPSNGFRAFLQRLPLESQCALKQYAAIGQNLDPMISSVEQWSELLQTLVNIDRFYEEIGGIIGYQAEALRLLRKKEGPSMEKAIFHSPVFEDISKETEEVLASIKDGLDALGCVAELYPLGGAADRLHLVDDQTGMELPAAKLPFSGRVLLETLIRDLSAREWLYFRLFGHQLYTPIAIMTSQEKDNHAHIFKICEERHWFGRPKENFRFFEQPLVPMIDGEGNWQTIGPFKLLLKPGGHGVIWKLARDEGIFQWLKSLGYQKAVVRQINNPLAGLDYGLLAFTGIGCKRNMSFGFASCCRMVKSAEGMIVLIEKDQFLSLTNIEYCDFEKFGIEDKPIHPNQPYSRFNSNTNILFVDLEAVEQAVMSHPFPGLLMNLKPGTYLNISGQLVQVPLARLESTMQNIADAFAEPKKMSTRFHVEKTFATYNFRHKTISVAKKAFVPGSSLLETPERCFYELLFAHRELLTECGFSLASEHTIEEYLEQGPSSLFLYHPALGPLYSVIRQKIRGGSLSRGSELLLEIAELDIEQLAIKGSIQIIAKRVMGKTRDDSLLEYTAQVGRCLLYEVSVKNAGIDWKKSSPFWKMDLHRKESLRIELEGFSEFDARGCHFEGPQQFIVEDGMRLIVRQKGGELILEKTAIQSKPLWEYSWQGKVQLTRSTTDRYHGSICSKQGT